MCAHTSNVLRDKKRIHVTFEDVCRALVSLEYHVLTKDGRYHCPCTDTKTDALRIGQTSKNIYWKVNYTWCDG